MKPLPPCPDCNLEQTGEMEFMHSDGCPNMAAMDARSEADRDFFAAHPGTNVYHRDAVPGDWGVASLGRWVPQGRVKVTQASPGIRMRVLPTLFISWDDLASDREPTANEAYVLAVVRAVQGGPVVPPEILEAFHYGEE